MRIAQRRRRLLNAVPPPPEGKVLTTREGWIPIVLMEDRARYGILASPVPSWRNDPSYDWAKKTKQKIARKRKRQEKLKAQKMGVSSTSKPSTT